ncbi:hypothetical protein [Clostridium drakei]|uniref:Uncharacterized protein n=1 Tax=Clostridium drakei TaxID=332101 RepID=A0A2U8DVE7_9CLOT|nr:hypothetical protein [Clostridium drakei]AWI06638.1 hypothetical protein B9W14_19780 [Clostridium drakei]
MIRNIKSSIYLIILIMYILLSSVFFNYKSHILIKKFDVFSIMILTLVFSILFGFLLNFENLIKKLRMQGKISWNIPKILICFILGVIIITSILEYLKIISIWYIMDISKYTLTLIGVLFGYLFSDLFEKQ